MTAPSVSTPAAVVGVDVGGTKIAAGLVGIEGRLLGSVLEVPTPAHEGPSAMLDAVAGLVLRVASHGVGEESADAGAHRGPVRPLAVGVGSAGVIDADSGLVVSSTDAITDWAGTDIAGGLRARLDQAGVLMPSGGALPVVVDNDVNAYALGEAWRGAGRGCASALVVAVGTGVGGAVILDGKVHHGRHFLAGEMGHMPSALAAGERCTCGIDGHLEAVAAGPQIARRYREASGDSRITTALEVERLAEGGDQIAQQVYHDAACALGAAIAQVVTVLDPDCVIVSGGLARSGSLWWDPLRSTVREALIPLVSESLELRPATLGTTAPIVGAAHAAALHCGLAPSP